MSVPPSVAGVEDISLNKISRDIAIGVTRTVIFERNGSAIEVKRLVGVEHVSRNRACRRWRKSEVPIFHSRAGGEMFPGIFVSGNCRACGVHPFIAIRVIEMPMRVHKMFNRVATDPLQRLGNLWARAQISRVDNEFAIGAGQDRDVATRADERANICSKCLSGDLGLGATRTSASDKILFSPEKLARCQT